jgi:hypothetical protein
MGQGTKNGYAEVVKRTQGRYEMLHEMRAVGATLTGGAGCPTSPFLARFLGDDRVLGPDFHLVYCDLLVSFPGAVDQSWHTDGGHRPGSTEHHPAHVLNCFIALDNIEVEMGPTEVRPGSQRLTRDIQRQMLLAVMRKRLRPRIRPAAALGDACIFDYRTLHRGIANDGARPRPVLGLVFARGWYKRDTINFPPRSVFDLTQPNSNATADDDEGEAWGGSLEEGAETGPGLASTDCVRARRQDPGICAEAVAQAAARVGLSIDPTSVRAALDAVATPALKSTLVDGVGVGGFKSLGSEGATEDIESLQRRATALAAWHDGSDGA